MLSQKQKRCAERISSLIAESREIAKLEKKWEYSTYIKERSQVNSWLIKVKNIIEVTFGRNSLHFKEMERLTNHRVEQASQVQAIEGFLIGALDDLENGFLIGQEFLIASDVFDSVIEEAKYLLKAGYKDPAAILGRVVLENALKRIARVENIADNAKASIINDELKKAGRYPQPQWRQVQTWLDIGNSAAHGRFDEYDTSSIENLLLGIEQFLATEFRD